MESTKKKLKSAFVIHQKDNVAVALSYLNKGDKCIVRLGESERVITVLDDINFGHKLACTAIEENESVLKYGEEIGRMSTSVEKGRWIHNHNMYCERGLK
ncbi:UxaA family hydrolase [Halobacillus naozhouensis]|uniref:UxaA family hydrolase n=1 Tax=Halobacillus naozhouensis TaxID=554880 RepID=A0ABY8J273_9BACI|nr:UxaA family hydrolase [Halobacillus naozhouensis]WFT75649.1 UxaA family hydrolase [Halobacillus naozhouensis]